MMQATRIFLVDDHPVVRAGIRLLIESRSRSRVVGETDSAAAALRQIPEAEPELVLLDLSLPDSSGITLARQLLARMSGLRLIALSMHEDPEYVQGFLEAGGLGYVPKSALEKQLLDAISAVSRGEYYVPPRLLAEVARELARPDPAGSARLTERERVVICHIARGETYREIAASLGISDKTVATYRERAADKLGLKTRADLVGWALENNLLNSL